MKNKGYQIIEPKILDEWMGVSVNREFSVALLHWVVANIRQEFGNRFPETEIDVICVRYLGVYPAIGVHYVNDDSIDADIETAINIATENFLKNRSVADFAAFVFAEKNEWSKIADRLLD